MVPAVLLERGGQAKSVNNSVWLQIQNAGTESVILALLMIALNKGFVRHPKNPQIRDFHIGVI